MHIPDGFLTNRIAVSMDAVSAAGVLYAAARVKLEDVGRKVPIMGVLAAFVFAAQMLNFPILGGTSGHLIGGALLGILLGPMAGLLTIATVIIAQALFLQDGGLIALGANIFNIGAVTTFSGYTLFRLSGGSGRAGRPAALAGFISGWLSLVLSSAACAVQMALSGAIPLHIGLPAMTGYHAIIGIVEGGLTAGVLTFLGRVRPDLLDYNSKARLGIADWIGAVVLVGMPTLILAVAGSSQLPDPLQRLIGVDPAAEGTVDPLSSPDRFGGYFIRTALFVLLIGVAYLASRVAQWKRSRS
ncbi:MAG TPA: energy-coupling factor ABC transporter permease [Acidobacteriota bacterium]|nr:energy-coupling factor ABC transporter permease [Acidobacteriota bacterium]